MKTALLISFLLVTTTWTAAAGPANTDPVRMLLSAPVRFEPAAKGQRRFIARGLRYQYEFEGNRARFRAGSKQAALHFEGASSRVSLEGIEALRSKSTTIRGNDPSQWSSNAANFGKLRARDLYPGIDLVYYGNAGELEYDLVVKPGADPGRVRLRFDGTQPRIDADGNLTADFIQKRPVAYQITPNGDRIPVSGRYRLNADGTFGIVLGRYDRTRELVIDPALTFSAFIAGGGADAAVAVAHDSHGFLYVAGTTVSTDFLLAGTPEQNTAGGDNDAFVTVIDPNATGSARFVYSTYFGGTGNETTTGLAVSPDGTVYLTGTVDSSDMPTANPAQLSITGTTDAFVVKLIPSQGTSGLYYSSYLGGTTSQTGGGIAVDSTGKIYVTGNTLSTDFPKTNGYQTSLAGGQDAFLAVIDPSLSLTATLIYSTYFGGSGNEVARSVAVGKDNTIWIAGGTFSSDMPILGYCYQAKYQGGGDGFLAQFNPPAGGSNSLLYATYYGGSSWDEIKKVFVDSQGRLAITGFTISEDLPLTSTAVQNYYGGNTDAFLAIVNPANVTSNRNDQLAYSTYFGGSQGEVGYDIKEDSLGRLYATGFTTSPDMPISPDALESVYDNNLDVFVVKMDPTVAGFSGLLFGSYFGSPGFQAGYGIDFDNNGNIYVAGYTTGPIFDKLHGAREDEGGGNEDGFLLGFNYCSFTLNPTSYQFPEGGSSITVKVTASSNDCPWTATSPLSWVTVSPSSGTGNGTVTVTAAANTTGAKQLGNVTIAGVSFLVGQDQ